MFLLVPPDFLVHLFQLVLIVLATKDVTSDQQTPYERRRERRLLSSGEPQERLACPGKVHTRKYALTQRTTVDGLNGIHNWLVRMARSKTPHTMRRSSTLRQNNRQSSFVKVTCCMVSKEACPSLICVSNASFRIMLLSSSDSSALIRVSLFRNARS